MKIVYDLDGVLRDFNSTFRKRFSIPPSKNWDIKYKGKGVYDWTRQDYSILYKSPPTKYFPIILKNSNGDKIEIWSHQPKDWRPYTLKWLGKYLDNKFTIRWLEPLQKFDRLMDNPDVMLVDDFPLFESYDKIILVDYLYNRTLKFPIGKECVTIRQVTERIQGELNGRKGI